MKTHTNWMTILWWAAAISVAVAASSSAQGGGGTLPFYAEPKIISSPGLWQVFAADFTGDGIPDMAMWAGDRVTVYPGVGDGTFGAGLTSVMTSGYFSGAWLGDFNGDGTPDLAMSEGEGLENTGISVAFGNGDGGFQPPQHVGALPYETVPAVGDFDGDGRSDIVGAGCWGLLTGGCGIIVLWGTPAGAFDKSIFGVDLGPSRVLHIFFGADVNGDGRPDLVWKQYQQNRFVVVPGLGSRAFDFAHAVPNTSAGEPSRFAAADFNADGMQDLAVLYSGGVGILYGNGDGTFDPVTRVGPWDNGGASGQRLAAWDFDSDGRPDLSIEAAEGLALFVNQGGGAFRRYALTAGVVEPHNYDAPSDYAVADFNDDGRPDFLVAWHDQKAGLYLGSAGCSTSLSVSGATSTVGQAVSLTATVTPAGLTGPVTFYDGAHVLGSATLSSGQAVFTTTTLAPGAYAFRAVYGGTLMDAPATLSSPVSHTVSAVPASAWRTSVDMNPGFLPDGLAAGDLNLDGRTDLAAGDYAFGRFGLFLGNGDGTLQSPLMSSPPGSYQSFGPRRPGLGDVNFDGKPDVFGTVGGYLGNGDGTFTPGGGFSGQALPADVNRDGKLDRVSGAGGQLLVYLGLGDRRGSILYFSSFSLVVSSHNSEMVLGDFDGDAKLDVAMTTAEENRLYILLGNGDGTFQTPRPSTRGNGPTSPVAADFNADGKLDLAFINAGTGTLSVLPGKGDGDFLAAIDTTLGGTLTRLIAADLSGDGKVDAAVLSTSEDRMIVLPGAGNGTFGAPRKYYAGTVPQDLVAADFNGDGRLDLAVSSNADILRGGPGRINLLLGVNPAPTAVQLQATPASTTLSEPVTLTATVSPSIATGWVTFNDGATPLGSAPVSAGQATFQTRLLGSGVHQLAAVFSGDGTVYGSSASAPATVHVAAMAVVEFAPTLGLTPPTASLAAQADFNADGIVDLVVADGPAAVLLGQGNGQFTVHDLSITFEHPANVLAADFNLDGKTDVAAGHMILFGKGDGTFDPAQAIAGTGSLVLAADFNGDGAPDLVDGYGRVLLNRGTGTFASPIQLTLGPTAAYSYAQAGDLNADGRADLVVPGGGYVYVLLASDNDTFLAPVPYPTVDNPRGVVIADLNGDGIPDLAVGGGNRVAIMLGLGAGTFENWGDVLTGLVDLRGGLYTCDCDGDGRTDLLAYNTDEPHPKLLRGVGDGTFEAPVNYGSVTGAFWILLADLNHDGRPDLVHNFWGGGIFVSMAVARSSVALKAAPDPVALSAAVTLTASVAPPDATGTITFYDGAFILGKAAIASGQATMTTKWLGAGVHALHAVYGGDPLRYVGSVSPSVSLTVAAGRNGGLGTGTTFATGRGPKGLATGDLNGDGKQDLVVANAASNTISVLLGNGAGGFAPRVNYNTGSAPVAIALADLDEDGAVDVVVANNGSTNVNVLRGNGNGTLQAAVNIAVPSAPQAIVAADVDGDQATEVVVGTSYGAYALGTVTGTPTTTTVLPWYSVTGISVVDLNGDLLADVAAVNGYGTALVQDAGGSFSQVGFSPGTTPAGLAVGDFNGDGHVDLATADTSANTANILLGNGNGTFQGAVNYATGSGPAAITTADVDGDGHPDLVIANGAGNSVTILRGQGDGTFAPGRTLSTGGAPAGVVAGDFDGNGLTDLAVTNAGDNTIRVFLGAARRPAGDFTGDLKADIVWRHGTQGDLWVWPMDGASRTTETYVRTVADTNWEIRGQGDLNGDGTADLLWRHRTTGMLYYWPMAGTTPLAETYVGTVDPAYDIVGTGDFNGDGTADILWRHTTWGDVWVWLMDGATVVSAVYVDRVDPTYVVKGVGDLDGDGEADIVWHHATTGEVWVWPMHGTTRLAQVWVGNVPDTGYQIQAVTDFTGDGQADLLWWHETLGQAWVWTMNGPARVAETWVGTVPDTAYRIVGAGDYDGDGQADILWRHATRGEVWVWIMNGTARVSETWVGTVPDTEYRIIK